MSTFKRLWNVGKGKARVTQKDLARGDWLEKARHKAADAAEAVADALRPPGSPPEERAPAPDPPPAQPEAGTPEEDPRTLAERIEREAGVPRKKTL